MHPLSQLARVGAVTVSALVLTGCASMEVHSYAERDVDFAQYHTYSWAPPDKWTTGDPRLDNNPFFQERIQAEVERQLSRRGYRKETTRRPDLTVSYHVRISQEVNVNGADRQSDSLQKGDAEPYVFEAGTLLFDLVDAQTNRLVWRGWVEGSVDGVINNQEWMEQKIDDVVARIFEQCPRRP